MPRAYPRLACFAFALFAATAVGADERAPSTDGAPGEEPKSYVWGLGVGGLSQQSSYTGIERDNFAIPLIYFENRWVQLFGPWLDIKAASFEWGESQELSFAGRVQFYGVNGYEPDDAPILEGMAERKNGILAGVSAKWSNPLVDVSAEWMYDVSGKSKGQRIRLGVERSFHVGEHWMFTPGVTAELMDEDYADYYFGVRPEEARAGRPAYVAGSTLNTEISMRTDYMFDQHQSVFLTLGYTALGGDIKDSPLTDRSNETMALLGYLYRF